MTELICYNFVYLEIKFNFLSFKLILLLHTFFRTNLAIYPSIFQFEFCPPCYLCNLPRGSTINASHNSWSYTFPKTNGWISFIIIQASLAKSLVRRMVQYIFMANLIVTNSITDNNDLVSL